jgi:hypothetical protein
MRFVLPVAFAGNYYVPAATPSDMQWRAAVANAPAVPYSGEYQRYEEYPYQFLAPQPQQAGSDWGSAAGMMAICAAIGLAGTMLAKLVAPPAPAPLAMLSVGGRAAVGGRRSGDVRMEVVDGTPYNNIWGLDWKKACFEAWDPEAQRTYTNFNPFERNDESAMCDTNGCFPGQSRGYKSPNRPDQSWEIMQAERAAMDELKKDPKFNLSGKPGNFSLKWQDHPLNKGAPP